MAKKILQGNPCARQEYSLPKVFSGFADKINNGIFHAARSNGELEIGPDARTIHDPIFPQEVGSQE
jgi:hypothetical protein